VSYDPFAVGPFTVAMRSGEATDAARPGRVLPFEVWYPEQVGKRGTRRPLIVASHSSGGHKRQLSYVCAHLASHGYVVAAPDHIGSTAADAAERARRAAKNDVLSAAAREALIARMIADRVPDLRAIISTMLGGGAGDVSRTIDSDRIGLVGWSFGGWSVLATPESDARVGAVAAFAPAGGSNPLPGTLPVALTFAWQRQVPTLLLAAASDRSVPLSGVQELFERTPSRKQMFVLGGADHGHFADLVADPGECSAEHAHVFTRALTLAHMDLALKRDGGAERFLSDDPAARIRDRGVAAVQYRG
jgi:predicted dienelactone hydrolase